MSASPTHGPLCPECGYNLTGRVGERCPECGWIIDEEVIRALEHTGAFTSQRWVRRVAIVASLTLALLTTAGILRRVRGLSFSWANRFDWLAAGAAGGAALGYVVLARVVWMSNPMGDQDRARIRRGLRMGALVSMIAGLVGASGAWGAIPLESGKPSILCPHSGQIDETTPVMLYPHLWQ